MSQHRDRRAFLGRHAWTAGLLVAALSACGGGGSGDAVQSVSAEMRQRQEAAALQKAVQMAREANAVRVQGERSHGAAQGGN